MNFFLNIMLLDEKNKDKGKENRTENCHAESMKKLAKLRFHKEIIVKHLRTSVEVPSTNATITQPDAQDESNETKPQDEEEKIKQDWFGWLCEK